MKKKFLPLLLVALFYSGIQVHGQIVSSRSVGIKTEKATPSETVWFLRTGLNIMNFSGDGAKGCDSNVGYNATIGYQKPLSSVGIYWGMEAGLGSRGFKADDIKCIAHNIQYSPFTFGWKYEVVDNVRIDLHAGAFLSFDYTSKMKEDGESISWGDFADALDVDYNRFDTGITIGLGVWYDRFNLDFAYQHGFIDAFSEFNGMKASNFMIRLGVAF